MFSEMLIILRLFQKALPIIPKPFTHPITGFYAIRLQGQELAVPPATTALGALLLHLKTPQKRFQPSNVHFGLMPVPEERLPKKARKAFYGERGRRDFGQWLTSQKKFIFLPG